MKPQRLILVFLTAALLAAFSLCGCANTKLFGYKDGSKPNDGGIGIQIDASKKKPAR